MKSYKSTYEAIGGAEGVRQIVEGFYPKVQKHPLIGPLFPEDINPVKEKQYQFLTQFFGGPSLFTDEHGHPMMRARHMGVPITEKHAEAWLDCMRRSLEETDLPNELQRHVLERLTGPAFHFVNKPLEEEA